MYDYETCGVCTFSREGGVSFLSLYFSKAKLRRAQRRCKKYVFGVLLYHIWHWRHGVVGRTRKDLFLGGDGSTHAPDIERPPYARLVRWKAIKSSFKSIPIFWVCLVTPLRNGLGRVLGRAGQVVVGQQVSTLHSPCSGGGDYSSCFVGLAEL